MQIRRLIILLLTAAILLNSAPGKAETAERSVSGSIEMATPEVYATPVVEHARCAWLIDGEASQGKLGYMVSLEGAETAGEHRFTLSIWPDKPATPGVPLSGYTALTFYGELGTCVGGAEVKRFWNLTNKVSGEIPAGSRYALIVPVYDVRPLNPNYCLFPWCLAFWVVPSVNGYPAKHGFRFVITPPPPPPPPTPVTPPPSPVPATAQRIEPSQSPPQQQRAEPAAKPQKKNKKKVSSKKRSRCKKKVKARKHRKKVTANQQSCRRIQRR